MRKETVLKDASPSELLEIACDVATEAGALAVAMRSAGISVRTSKSNVLDIVTQADTAVEELIRKRLADLRPHDGFFGEEGGAEAGDSEVMWIVDPIDGTVNYLYGSTYYAVSIAATVLDADGMPTSVAGCVYAPQLSAMYTATQGGGALLNGTAVHVNAGVALEKALLSTGIPYDLSQRGRVLQDLFTLITRVRDFRLVGAAALEICGVAEGRTDGHFQRGLPIWDYAAATLIAAEAGADIRALDSTSTSTQLLIVASTQLADALEPFLG